MDLKWVVTMLTATALIFPLALVAALSTIAMMLHGYAAKMMAVLRMEPNEGMPQAPYPPARITPQSVSIVQAHVATPAPATLAA